MIRCFFRRARKVFIAAIFACGAGGFAPSAHAFLDSEKAWNELLQFAVRQINAPGEFEIKLGQVTRPEDGFALISKLQILDSDGVWLDAHNLRIDWNPSSLLRGRFAFETLSAETIQILRAPIARTGAPGESAQIDFAWPRPPVSTVVQNLRVEQMIIEGGLLPQDIRAEIEGRFFDLGDVQEATLSVKRSDRPGDTINLGTRIDFDALDISISLEAAEAPGGLVGELAGLPASESLDVFLAAAGTPEELPFSLFADIGQIGIAEGEGVAQWQEKKSITFDGFVEPGPKSAQHWRGALGERAKIVLDAEQSEDGSYSLNTLDFDSRAAQFTGKGIVDLAGNATDMAFDWSAKDIEALNEVIAPAHVASVNGSAKAIGKLTAPKIDVIAAVRDLKAGFGQVRAMDLRIDSSPEGDGTDSASGVQGFSLIAKAEGLALNDTDLQDALGPNPTLKGTGAFYGNEGRASLDKLSLKAASIDLLGDASFNLLTSAINAELSGSARNLGPFLKVAGIPVDGAATLALKIQNLTSTAVERLFLNAQLTDLSSSDPNYAALIGETAVLEALLVEAEPDVVKIDRGFFESATLRADAKGTVSIPNDVIDVALDWRLIDADRIAPIITPVRIKDAEGTAILKSSLSEPKIDVESTLSGVSYPGYTATEVDASTSLLLRTDRRAPYTISASLADFSADDPMQNALIGSDPRVASSGIYDTATSLLSVDELTAAIAAGNFELAGDINPRKETLSITYGLKSSDLDAIGAAAGLELGGAIDAEGKIDGSFTAPLISTRTDAENLRFNGYGVKALDLDIVAEAAEDGATPFSLNLRASEPDLADPALNEMIGQSPEISANGSFNPVGPRIELKSFDAILQQLAASASGAVDMAAETFDLAFDLDAAKLNGLSAVLGKKVAGALKAKGRANGSFTAPQVDAIIDGSKLRYADYSIGSIKGELDVDQSATGYAPFDVDLVASDVDLGDPSLNDLIGKSPTIKAVGSFSQSEQALRLKSAAFKTNAITGTASGSIDLSAQLMDLTYDVDARSLAPIGLVAGLDLAGTVSAKGTASGSFQAPQLDTTITGRNLQYEEYSVGTIEGTLDIRQAPEGFAPFDIDITASEVSLGDPALNGLIGEKVTLTADGGFNQSEKHLRLDGMALNSAIVKAGAKGIVDLDQQTMDIDFDVDANALSPLTPLVGSNISGSLRTQGTASGSFSEPSLFSTVDGQDIRFDTYRVARIGGRIGLTHKPKSASPFDIDLTASGIDLGDPALNSAIGDEATLVARGEFDQAKQFLRLREVGASTNAAKLHAVGTLDIKHQTVDLSYDVDADTLAPFSVFTGNDLGGSIRSTGHLAGSLTSPRLSSTLAGRGLRYGPYSVGLIEGKVNLPQSSAGLAPFDVDVQVSGIELGNPSLNALIGDFATVTANGRLDQSAQILQLDTASVSTNAASATASGEINLGAQTLNVGFSLDAKDLTGSSSLLGTPFGGSLKANGSVRGPFAAPLINADANGAGLYFDQYSVGALDLNLTMQGGNDGRAPYSLNTHLWQPKIGNPAIESLLGEEVTLVASGTLDQASQLLRIDDATARAAIGGARIIGNMDLRGQMLDLGYIAHLPALDMLQPVVNSPLGGDARVDGKVTGSFSDPSTSGVLTAAAAYFNTYQFGDLTAHYDVQRLISGPAGHASLNATTPQGPINASTSFDLSGEVPQISNLDVKGLGINATGSFRGVPGGLYEGDLFLNASDFTPLGNLIEQEISGAATGTIRLSPQNGGQHVVVDLTGSNVRYAQGGQEIALIGTVDVDGQVGDAFGADPYVDGRMNANNATVTGFPVQHVDITAQGPLSNLNATITGAGGETGSERIDAVTRATLVGFPRGADLSSFSLSYQGVNLTAVDQFSIQEVSGGGWRASGLNLRLDDGEIIGSGEYSPNGVVANLQFRNVPMQLTQLSGFNLIRSGRLDGFMDIDTRGAPKGSFALNATTLRLQGAQLDDPFDITVKGTMDGKALSATAQMDGDIIEVPLVAQARIPLTSSVGTPFPLPNRDAPFSASIDWSGDVSEFWAYVPVPDHILSGPVTIQGRASGTMNAPMLEGGAVLTEGRYEQLEFGTLLTNLNAKADFTHDGRVVFSSTANDGVAGTVSSRGSYMVANGAMDAQLTLDKAALVRRDDATAVISGTATARSAGNRSDIEIAGAFHTDFVELRLIGGYGSSLVVVDAIPVGETAPLYVEPGEPADPQRIALDVSLDFPQEVFVRGRGLESEWGGQIKASGFASDLKVTGAIEKRRGWLDLLGNQFELETGEVRFSGALDPYIRIRLQRAANDITGWLDVTGPASDLEIGFGSNPALPEDEVLPRLLFGRSKQSLSPLEAAQLAAGVATLLSGRESAVDSVRGALGVDVLRLEGDDEGGMTVSTGKYISPGFFVGAKQNITTGQSSALVEIEVFENFDLEAELGAEESTAGGTWNLDY